MNWQLREIARPRHGSNPSDRLAEHCRDLGRRDHVQAGFASPPDGALAAGIGVDPAVVVARECRICCGLYWARSIRAHLTVVGPKLASIARFGTSRGPKKPTDHLSKADRNPSRTRTDGQASALHAAGLVIRACALHTSRPPLGCTRDSAACRVGLVHRWPHGVVRTPCPGRSSDARIVSQTRRFRLRVDPEVV
jgi:hypothetical protein